jgi:hypothetical protein
MRFVCSISAALLVLACLRSAAQTPSEAEAEPASATFSASPSLGATYQEIDHTEGSATRNLQWLFNLESHLEVDGGGMQFSGLYLAQYGQVHSRESIPKKTQDDMVLTLMPSIPVSDALGLRLFFEVTGETQFARGDIDGVETAFLDPLFAYETLFLGQRIRAGAAGSGRLDLTYGVGYAAQQTVTQHFVFEEHRNLTVDENNPLRNVQDATTLESGYSAVFYLNYTNKFTPDAGVHALLRTVALTKTPEPKSADQVRASALALVGLKFHFFDLSYSLRLLVDPNFSKRRQLDQSMVVGVRFDL